MGSSCFASQNGEGIQIYQKNVHLSPEHKQKLVEDITRYRNADNLWDVLRDQFALNHYENTSAVQDKIEWYMNNQDDLLRAASRAAPYLYYISRQVKKRHLPAELVLLPIIESGYNPFSLSSVGAAGIWQLMPDTASGLGVKRDSGYDGRRDIIASTRAALNYLAYLQTFFEGNWLLAIAAYNTGEGNVLAAIRRNIREGKDTDFWSLPVAQETKDYVPSLLALATIISHPDQYPIYFPPVRNAPYLAQIDAGKQLNLKYAAELAGMSYKKIMQLNPGYSRPSSSTKGPYKLVVPIENVEQFTENLARSPLNHQINWAHYKVKSGDTLASIAKKFEITINDIRKMNHLSKSSIRAGTNLLIPNNGQIKIAADESHSDADEFEHQKSNIFTSVGKNKLNGIKKEIAYETKQPYTLKPGDTVYMIRSKDTLATIAKRFHISTQSLLAANQLSKSKLQTGKQLIIPTHAKTSTSSNNPLTSGDTIYMVRKGDSIENIARKFKTTEAAIRLINLVDNETLSEGDKLIIPTHMRG